MTVTIRDVALRAGVSPMTVSRVVNGSPNVKTETRLRVEQAVSELSYVPNSLARGLSRQRTGTIGLVVPDFGDPFFTLILRGAENVARRAGFRVILCNTDSDLELEDGYVEDLISHQVDGLLIAPVNDQSRRTLIKLAQHKTPHVLIDRSVPGSESDLVQGDSVGGSRILVEHLIGLGHSVIGHITESQNVSTARDRLRGYREALEGAGIRFDEALVVEAEGATTRFAQLATDRLLNGEREPTAIFAVNNLAAVGVVLAVRERGLSVPGDVAVTCFDDIELAALLCPFLTVMAQPAETFGTLATQLLLDHIHGRGPARRRVVVLPGDLIIRESSGA